MNPFFKSFEFAFSGLKFAWKGRNFKVQIVLGVFACYLAYVFEIPKFDWLILTLSIGTVLSAEIFNSAIEQLCNLIDPNQNPSIKIIKDLSASAVLILSFAAFLIGLILFLPKL